jgi:hypothetical protein
LMRSRILRARTSTSLSHLLAQCHNEPVEGCYRVLLSCLAPTRHKASMNTAHVSGSSDETLASQRQAVPAGPGCSSLGPVRQDFSEMGVGICSYANDASGFRGILKQVAMTLKSIYSLF